MPRCFTIETAVHGREGRCRTAGVGYVRLWSVCLAMVGVVRTVLVQKFASLRYPVVQLQIAGCRVMVGSRWLWVADGEALLLGRIARRHVM